MRHLFVAALAAALVAAASFVGSPSTVVRAQATDLLPTQAELNTALAPLKVSSYMAGPGQDGWDANAEFDIDGSPDGMMHASVDASELPTKEGAAGFLQTKLQQLRDGTRQGGFIGDVGPAGDTLTQDADEAYFGVYQSPPGAPPMLVALQISRYEDQVIATTVMLRGNGPISEGAAQNLGFITGQLLKLMNED
ncbi:MAG: hypothetical protein U0893_14465 [Chloroflexota bacterium]